MINTRSFRFISVGFRRRFKVWNLKTKRFLNKTIFSNFICIITSAKFFTDSATKTTISISNDLKMIDVLISIISMSSTLMQMSKNVVEDSNPPKHSSLARLSEPAKIGWEVMISFIMDFDNSIVFYSSFYLFFFFLAFPASQSLRVPPHLRRTDGLRRRVKKNRRCDVFLNWSVFKFDHFMNFIEWDSCFSRVFLRPLCSFVEWTVYYFLCSQK